MSVLLDVKRAIDEAASSCFDYAGPTRLRPLMDRSLGDITTDLCFMLGEQSHQNPEVIADAILQRLPPDIRPCVTASQGFLNILVRDCLFPSSAFERPPTRSISVVLGAAQLTMNGWPYMRLLSSVLVQSSLLLQAGLAVRVTVGDRHYEPSAPWDEGFARQVISDSLSVQASADEHLGLLTNALVDPHEWCVVWLSPYSLERRAFQRLYLDHFKGYGCRVLRCPEKRWCAGLRGDEPNLFAVTDLPTRALWGTLLLCAGPRFAHELDPHVARFNESDNIVWLLESTLARLARESLDAPPRELSPEHPVLREISVLARTLPQRILRGGVYGEVSDAMLSIETTARRITAALNAPPLRRMLAGHDLEFLSIVREARDALSESIQFERGHGSL